MEFVTCARESFYGQILKAAMRDNGVLDSAVC
jgi:hypothetical protein